MDNVPDMSAKCLKNEDIPHDDVLTTPSPEGTALRVRDERAFAAR